MDNSINFDKINMPLTHGKMEKNSNKSTSPAKEEGAGVLVTTNLGKLIGLLSVDDGATEVNTRVMDMKNRIQNNEYKVDLNMLSDKLLNSGVLRIAEK